MVLLRPAGSSGGVGGARMGSGGHTRDARVCKRRLFFGSEQDPMESLQSPLPPPSHPAGPSPPSPCWPIAAQRYC
jgi:hypothetical protein